MAKIKISGENPFQILAHSFSISPSSESYILQYSADGVNFTDWEETTPANETLVVNGVGKSMYYKLKNNNSEVEIQY